MQAKSSKTWAIISSELNGLHGHGHSLITSLCFLLNFRFHSRILPSKRRDTSLLLMFYERDGSICKNQLNFSQNAAGIRGPYSKIEIKIFLKEVHAAIANFTLHHIKCFWFVDSSKLYQGDDFWCVLPLWVCVNDERRIQYIEHFS